MEILESLRYALRSRIIPGIVPVTEFQRQGADAPGAPLYIRETIIEASAGIITQNTEERRFLCEYDMTMKHCFVSLHNMKQLHFISL
jgi:hypothetical protein